MSAGTITITAGGAQPGGEQLPQARRHLHRHAHRGQRPDHRAQVELLADASHGTWKANRILNLTAIDDGQARMARPSSTWRANDPLTGTQVEQLKHRRPVGRTPPAGASIDIQNHLVGSQALASIRTNDNDYPDIDNVMALAPARGRARGFRRPLLLAPAGDRDDVPRRLGRRPRRPPRAGEGEWRSDGAVPRARRPPPFALGRYQSRGQAPPPLHDRLCDPGRRGGARRQHGRPLPRPADQWWPRPAPRRPTTSEGDTRLAALRARTTPTVDRGHHRRADDGTADKRIWWEPRASTQAPGALPPWDLDESHSSSSRANGDVARATGLSAVGTYGAGADAAAEALAVLNGRRRPRRDHPRAASTGGHHRGLEGVAAACRS